MTHTDKRLLDGVTENVSHAWYEGDKTLHPWRGETNPLYTGFQDDGKYTWVKSPRFEGRPMQAGPLAQVLIGYAQGHKLTHKWAGEAINRVSAISKRQVTPVMLHSTLGRIAARAIRASMLADLADKHWNLLVKNISSGDAKIYVKPQFGDKELHGAAFQPTVPTKHRSWAIRLPIRSALWKSFVLSIPSIHVLPAPFIRSIRTERKPSTFPERGCYARYDESHASKNWRSHD